MGLRKTTNLQHDCAWNITGNQNATGKRTCSTGNCQRALTQRKCICKWELPSRASLAEVGRIGFFFLLRGLLLASGQTHQFDHSSSNLTLESEAPRTSSRALLQFLANATACTIQTCAPVGLENDVEDCARIKQNSTHSTLSISLHGRFGALGS